MMNAIFSDLEKDYHIYMKDVDNLIYEINLTDLFIDEKLQEFISFYGDKIKSLDNKVQAAYFSGYLGRFCAGIQYLMNHEIKIDLSLENISLQIYEDHQYDSVEMCFKLRNITIETEPDHKHIWKKQVLENFYRETVMPLLEVWHLSTNITIEHLLGQICARLYYFHEQLIEKAETIEQKNKIQQNFDLLIKGINPQVFKKNYNPFDTSFEMIESPWNPNKMLRMKKSCCLYYLTQGATCKCYTCPEMTEEERLIRKKEIMEEEAKG